MEEKKLQQLKSKFYKTFSKPRVTHFNVRNLGIKKHRFHKSCSINMN